MTVRISKIPDATKDQFINGLEASLAQQNDRRGDEPEAEYKSRMVTTRLGKTAIASLVPRGGDPRARLEPGPRPRRDLPEPGRLPRRPGTAMAESLRSFSKQRSRFAWLGSGSPLAAWVSLPVPKEFRDVLAELLEQARKDAEEKAKTEVEKTLAGRLFELLKQNITAEEMDMGWAIQGPHKTPSGQMLFGLFGGIKVRDGKQLERLVRDAIAKQPPAEEDLKVTFDAAKGDDGTPIHQLAIPESKLDAEMVKKIGKSPIFVAFAGNAVVVSMGEGGLKAIQQALGNIAKEPPGAPSEPAALRKPAELAGRARRPESRGRAEGRRRGLPGARSPIATACGSASRRTSKPSSSGSGSTSLRAQVRRDDRPDEGRPTPGEVSGSAR